jgi:hypothetical protein
MEVVSILITNCARIYIFSRQYVQLSLVPSHQHTLASITTLRTSIVVAATIAALSSTTLAHGDVTRYFIIGQIYEG